MRPSFRSIWVLIAASLLGRVAPAIEIGYQFDPSRHNRFLSGFGTNPVQNPNVLGMPGLDFSGVGWGSGGDQFTNVALVTPEHFISANHYHPPVGSFLNFLGTDGIVRTRQIQSYTQLHFNPNDLTSNFSDLVVGQLSAPFTPADNIRIYPVVRPGAFQYPLSSNPPSFLDFYRGQQIVVVGKNDTGAPDADSDGYNDRGGKIALHTIDDVFDFNFGTNETNTVGFGHWFHPNTPDLGHFIGGDSGSPTFMLWDGQLTILGAHSGVDADPDNNPLTLDQYNVDSFLPFYVDQINSLIQASGFQIQILTPVPEPGTLTLIGLAGAGLFLRRWRRRVVA